MRVFILTQPQEPLDVPINDLGENAKRDSYAFTVRADLLARCARRRRRGP